MTVHGGVMSHWQATFFFVLLLVEPALAVMVLPEIDPSVATTPLTLAVMSLFVAADRFRRTN
jgi:hypothetical protein